ncbi:hypothetical protein AGMMS49965_02360 [Bacteroidia bacterium]|nr:hypothetical protein AGMMS49965_02360 [Bacteroidia bacterium]
MPRFNSDSVLRANEQSERGMQRVYSFAYKFVTHIERGRDGAEVVLDDGTRVWQVGIASEGAYSINVLFTEFDIPEGAQLFLYNKEHSHVIGAFDARNSSPEKMLPVRPVYGDSIFVEYSEPADAAFRGRLVVGEVNHDYRGVLRMEPQPDAASWANPSGGAYLCMPDARCTDDADAQLVRSSLLLMVDGTLISSGNLINNTNNDGRTYVYTSAHCLNDGRLGALDEFYQEKAQTAIVFFNYNRPVCGTAMKGMEEMSLAGARAAAISGKKDIALLEFYSRPPEEYNAYYAGWNANADPPPPFTNLHHPGGAVTKYGKTNRIEATSWNSNAPNFDRDSHWKVPSWTVGSTHGGSSGSSIYDGNGLIIGGLTGGTSTCSGTAPTGQSDYFTSLHVGWTTLGWTDSINTPNSSDRINPLVAALANNSSATRCAGYDPHADNPFKRIREVNSTLDGRSPSKSSKVTKSYTADENCQLWGLFIQMPIMQEKVSATVHLVVDGDTVASQPFEPTFAEYGSGSLEKLPKTMTVPTESYLAFDAPKFAMPVDVGTQFEVVYQITEGTSQKFPDAIYPWLRGGGNSGGNGRDFTCISNLIVQIWDNVLSVRSNPDLYDYEFVAYQWQQNGVDMAGETAGNLHFSDLTLPDIYTTEYSVRLTTTAGQTLQSCPIKLQQMMDATSLQRVEVDAPSSHPNPTSGTVVIKDTAIKTGDRIEIYNLNGQLMRHFSAQSEQTTIDISSFPTGIYILKVNNKQIKVIKR